MTAIFQTIVGYEDIATRKQPLKSQDIKKNWVDVTRAVLDFELDLKNPTKNFNLRSVQVLSVLTPPIDRVVFVYSGNFFLMVSLIRNPTVVSSPAYLAKLDAFLPKTSA
ncbi:hypothetical protein F5H01DRAFT_365067 [Linnemannia elongata]|nr:hypothetical protein F5H01DRAFT_365067 [Linnemannia elongata]